MAAGGPPAIRPPSQLTSAAVPRPASESRFKGGPRAAPFPAPAPCQACHAGLNGFGFGPDGRIYAPLFGSDQLVAIDVGSGAFTTVATGVGSPSAAKPDGHGHLFSVDYLRGDVWRTDLASGASQKVATLREPLDNLAIDRDGVVYVSSTADSSIFALDW